MNNRGREIVREAQGSVCTEFFYSAVLCSRLAAQARSSVLRRPSTAPDGDTVKSDTAWTLEPGRWGGRSSRLQRAGAPLRCARVVTVLSSALR